MAGEIKRLIDHIITERCKGNNALILTTKTKLVLKGIDPDKYTEASADDSTVIVKLKEVAAQMGVPC